MDMALLKDDEQEQRQKKRIFKMATPLSLTDRTAIDHLQRTTELMFVKATAPFVNQNLTKPL
jgi:hypothetical protein